MALGAFCTHDTVSLAALAEGPLSGLRFAAKDLFNVAGHACCAGVPDFLRSQPPASMTAPAITTLLDAGASLIGKTILDELAYGMTGENVHYGTPPNPRAPGRVPGGSSSGSASAVAAGEVDFALGTDTGGSGRVPASYCGIFGYRPTHGRIPVAGVIALAPSFDTVAWFARDPGVMHAVGRVLMAPGERAAHPARRIILADDTFDAAHPSTRTALLAAADAFADAAALPVEHAQVADVGLQDWAETFGVIQAREAWMTHGAWIERTHPAFGPAVAGRFADAARVSESAALDARRRRSEIAARLSTLLNGDAILCLPASFSIAPLHNHGEAERGANRRLTCIAPLGGMPQISLPVAEVDGCPLGLSLAAARGADETLLALARYAGGERLKPA